MKELYKESVNREGFAIPYYEIPYEKFFQFGLSVDCVVFGYHENKLKVLLIKRGAKPYLGKWALPGDLVYPNENIESAANRVLRDLTEIDSLFLEQTKTYGQVDRHPAGRVITTGFYAIIDIAKHDPHAAAWADGIYWVDADNIPQLAFDHNQILTDALRILREQVGKQPVGFELLPSKFTLGELQALYEGLLGVSFDKANFRKRMLSMDVLIDCDEYQKNVPHRPGKLYSFDLKRYSELKSKGSNFEI
ncbi:MAG TPA: NUDIX hydrolase [Flavobacteriales bacterium]|jgi:8-oxo-dGTP diphosphatase|nr:NUDIX hydrolase [Flavobacteriales bacterium]